MQHVTQADAQSTSKRSPLFAASPVLLFIIGATTQYLGASVAVSLFDEVHPVALAWMRSLSAGIVLALILKPRPWQWERQRVINTAVFGVLLVGMNTTFYLAIDTLPLGTAVAIEFVGPVAVGLIGCRSARNLAALGMGALGVALLAGIEAEANATGLLWISGAACCWAGYIVWGKRVSTDGAGGLAVAMACGVIAFSPVAAPLSIDIWQSPRLVGLAVVVGMMTSAVPYGIDQLVLARVDQTQFAILLAVLPATATVVGAIALDQIPTPLELLGIGCVICAVLIRERLSVSSSPPDTDVESAALT